MVRLGERMGLVALGAFVVLDVVLVRAAVNRTRPEVSEAPVSATAASAAVTTLSATTRPAPTDHAMRAGTEAGGESARRVDPATLRVGIVAVNADSAWRYTTGSCDSGGSTLALTSPRDPTAVGTGAGRTAKPCGATAVIDLAITDTGAAALCTDGRVMTTATESAVPRSTVRSVSPCRPRGAAW